MARSLLGPWLILDVKNQSACQALGFSVACAIFVLRRLPPWSAKSAISMAIAQRQGHGNMMHGVWFEVVLSVCMRGSITFHDPLDRDHGRNVLDLQ